MDTIWSKKHLALQRHPLMVRGSRRFCALLVATVLAGSPFTILSVKEKRQPGVTRQAAHDPFWRPVLLADVAVTIGLFVALLTVGLRLALLQERLRKQMAEADRTGELER